MFSKYALIVVILFSLACGGGGGGDSFVGSANVTLEVTPTTVDTGDRLRVKVIIRDAETNNIILKVEYPAEFSYVFSSSTLKIGDDVDDIVPDFDEKDDDVGYLVYFLDVESLADKSGELTLELEGTDFLSKGKISVDADVDDPLIPNSDEFSFDEPEFLSEDDVEVKILG